jgi:hypothetical protein
MVRARVKRSAVSFTNVDVDYAIKQVVYDMDLETYFSLIYTDPVTMEQYNPEIDISGMVPADSGATTATGIRPERVVRCELAYTDRGTWSGSSVSYSPQDLVKGDGTPDSYFYVCTTANTSSSSNEPGTSDGDGYWARRAWKRGDPINLINRDNVANRLGTGIVGGVYPMWWPFPDAGPQAPGQPVTGAFLTQDLFIVWPPPNLAYKMVFIMQYPVTEWEPGESGAVDLLIPDNIIIPAIDGICSKLDSDHPLAEKWERQFQVHKRKVMGTTIIDAGVPTRDRAAYLDHTDAILDPYGPFGIYGPRI